MVQVISSSVNMTLQRKVYHNSRHCLYRGLILIYTAYHLRMKMKKQTSLSSYGRIEITQMLATNVKRVVNTCGICGNLAQPSKLYIGMWKREKENLTTLQWHLNIRLTMWKHLYIQAQEYLTSI